MKKNDYININYKKESKFNKMDMIDSIFPMKLLCV